MIDGTSQSSSPLIRNTEKLSSYLALLFLSSLPSFPNPDIEPHGFLNIQPTHFKLHAEDFGRPTHTASILDIMLDGPLSAAVFNNA